MEWTWTKNARAEAAFLKIDQLIALLRSARQWQMLVEETPQGDRPVMTEEQLDGLLLLAGSLADDLHRLMRQTLPDPDRWVMQEMARIEAAKRTPALAQEGPPCARAG